MFILHRLPPPPAEFLHHDRTQPHPSSAQRASTHSKTNRPQSSKSALKSESLAHVSQHQQLLMTRSNSVPQQNINNQRNPLRSSDRGKSDSHSRTNSDIGTVRPPVHSRSASDASMPIYASPRASFTPNRQISSNVQNSPSGQSTNYRTPKNDTRPFSPPNHDLNNSLVSDPGVHNSSRDLGYDTLPMASSGGRRVEHHRQMSEPDPNWM